MRSSPLADRSDDRDGDVAPEGAASPSDETDTRVQELENRLRYALADLDNMRKRFGREIERERGAERERAARLWLPVLDHLDLALSHLDDDISARAGIESIRTAALDAIAEMGFPRFDDVGRPFDPERHEAVSIVPAPDEPNTVVAALRPGYGADVVLRPASVIVGKADDDG